MALFLALLKALPLLVAIIDRVMRAREAARKKRDLRDLGKALVEENEDEVARFLEELGI